MFFLCGLVACLLAGAITPTRNVVSGAARLVRSFALGSPALGTTTAVMAATSAAAGSTVTTGFTNPDVPRNLTATTTGTAGNVTAVSVTVNGTDYYGQAISETLPAFTAGALGTVIGAKAFRTVTSVVIPTVGASVNVSVGTGAKLGLPTPISRDTVEAAYLNGVRESTRPTVTFDNTNISGNTVALSSALNGSAVIADYYDS